LKFRCAELSVIHQSFQVVPAHFTVKPPTEPPQGSFVALIIFPNHHDHDLELSGSCESSKSESLLHQHPQSAPFQLHSQVWNNVFPAVFPIPAPDPDWWTLNINSQFVSSDIEVHQECLIALASVSLKPPRANEVGMDSLSAVFQPASQPSGLSQQSFYFNEPANFDIDCEQEALLAFPDSASYMEVRNSISPLQLDWNSMASTSTPRSNCDFSSMTSRVSTPLGNETLCQESQQHRKNQISVFRSFKCPHCPKQFASKYRLESHIQNSHRHPSICSDCGKSFTLSKDLNRHRQLLSCQEGLSPTRLFACKCGKTYPRKDRLLRHLRTRKSEGDKHHAV